MNEERLWGPLSFLLFDHQNTDKADDAGGGALKRLKRHFLLGWGHRLTEPPQLSYQVGGPLHLQREHSLFAVRNLVRGVSRPPYCQPDPTGWTL